MRSPDRYTILVNEISRFESSARRHEDYSRLIRAAQSALQPGVGIGWFQIEKAIEEALKLNGDPAP